MLAFLGVCGCQSGPPARHIFVSPLDSPWIRETSHARELKQGPVAPGAEPLTFALGLWRTVAHQPGDLLIAPLSLVQELAALQSGDAHPPALTGGDSLASQRIYLANGTKPGQIQRARKLFATELYGARKAETIDAWLSKTTSFPALGAPIRGDLLVGSIGLKFIWLKPFLPSNTQKESYFVGSQERMVSTMTQVETFDYSENSECQMVELPLRGDKLVLDLLLPRKVEGLGDVEAALTPKKLVSLFEGLRPKVVRLEIPHFHVATRVELTRSLHRLGLAKRELTAFQFVDIEANESGTDEPAGGGGMDSSAKTDVDFFTNHPFMIILREKKSNHLVLLGRVVYPPP